VPGGRVQGFEGRKVWAVFVVVEVEVLEVGVVGLAMVMVRIGIGD
jgi:hypothetical protein